MTKKLLLSVSLLCAFVSAQAHAFLDDFSVFVINDERDDPVLLNGNADIIDTGLLPDLMCCGGEHSGLVKPLYAQNPLVLSGMIGRMKAYIDQGSQDASRDSTKKSWLTFWKSLSCSDTSQTCTGVIQTTLNQFDEAAYVTQPDLQAMVQSIVGDYNESLVNENGVHYGMKKLIISHGRGSFYANQAWNYINLHNPNIARCIGIVAIGTPATYVSNSGQYTTNDIDKVVNLTRSMAWWGNNILPANYSLGSSWLLRDITAHDLFTTYLSNSGIVTQLRSQITSVANQINVACPPPPPPPPERSCESTRTSGGAGGYDFTQYIGSGYHLVDFTFIQTQVSNSLATDLIVSGGGVQLPPRSDPDGINANDNDTDDASNGLNLWQLRFNGNGDDVYLHIHIGSWGDTWSIDSHCH